MLVVDRDDDLGVKTGIESPVVGRENVLKAAEALLLADPEDADGNTIFAAVKIYDELSAQGRDVEVALVTGDSKLGLIADMKIKKALDEIFSKGNYEGVIFVSDGAEDDQVLPLISSYAPIVSKKTVIVKQAQQLERTFYTIKTALEDPSFARLFLGIPGVILLLWFLFQENALRVIIGLLGVYLLLRGFGLEEPLVGTLKAYLSINPHSSALPFHVASIAILIGALFLAVHTYTYFPDQGVALYEALRVGGFTTGIAVLVFLVGKSIEAFHRRESYKIGDYIIFGATVLVLLVTGDALINFLEGRGSAGLAAVTVIVSLVSYFLLAKLGGFIRKAVLYSKDVVGATLYDRTGVRMGKVRRVRPEDKVLVVERGRRTLRIPVERVRIEAGRLILQ